MFYPILNNFTYSLENVIYFYKFWMTNLSHFVKILRRFLEVLITLCRSLKFIIIYSAMLVKISMCLIPFCCYSLIEFMILWYSRLMYNHCNIIVHPTNIFREYT